MIYTGYFANLSHANTSLIYSIANSMPKGISLQKFKPFVPEWDLVSRYKKGMLSWSDFRGLYIKQLDKLPSDVFDTLSSLTDDVVFMCWEAPDQPCHRHILREYLNSRGIPAKEYPCAKKVFKSGDSQ